MENKTDEAAVSNELYLVLNCASRQYAISIAEVERITYLKHIAAKEERPRLGRGTFNYYEEVLELIDLRFFLEGKSTCSMEKKCAIIVSLNNKRYGLIVDGVVEILWDLKVQPFTDDEPQDEEMEKLKTRLSGFIEKGSLHYMVLNTDLLARQVLNEMGEESVF